MRNGNINNNKLTIILYLLATQEKQHVSKMKYPASHGLVVQRDEGDVQTHLSVSLRSCM